MRIRTMEIAVGVLSFCLINLVNSVRGSGQSDHTQLSGFVRDASGGVVPGVKVMVKCEGMEFERSAISSDAGYYIVTNLPPGYYTVTAELAGFKRHQTGHKKLDPNIAATEDIVLLVGVPSETVYVEASASAIQSDSATVGRLIEGKHLQMMQIPGRNPLFLALVKAGINGPPASSLSFAIGGGGNFSINGSRPQENLITLDGAVAVRTRGNGTSIGVADVDTVQEVQILAANYGAEFGRSSGGQIRIVTKSGTRDFHGNAYEFFRNSALDANTWSRNRTSTSGDKPCARFPGEVQCRPDPYRFNQFGYNLSGPATLPFMGFNRARNKLFWLWAQEWVRHRRGTTASDTVPSLKMRQGDFSELLDPANRFFGRARQVRDPNTQQPFPGNVIPPTRLSPNGIGFLKAFPEPTPGYLGPGTANYFQEGPDWANQRKDTIAIDFHPTKRHAIHWRAQLYHYINYSWQRNRTDRVPGGLNRPNQTTSLNWTWMISPTLSNGFLAAGSRDQVYAYIDTSKGKYRRGQYGIDYPYVFPEGKLIPDRIPSISIPGIVALSGSQFPASSTGPIYSYSDNVTKIWGKHTLKAGILFERSGQNDNDQIALNPNGTFSFLDTRPNGSGLALANAVLGLFTTYTEVGVRSYTPYRGHMLEWFVQDGWKVTPKLRLELGLRHSIIQPYSSLWRNMVVFDEQSYDPKIAVVQDRTTGFILSGDLRSRYNGLVIPGDGWTDAAKGRISIADSGEYNFMFRGLPKQYSRIHKDNFQPRVGLAYAINNKTVLRSGVGRFFTRLGVSDSVFLGANPPLQPIASISNGSADRPAGGTAISYPLSPTTQDPLFPNPESWIWNVTFERQLPFETTAAIAYVGRRGLHNQRERNINQLQPGTIQANPGVNPDYLRPYKGFGPIRATNNDGSSRYNGLQIEAFRRFTKGFGFSAAYTYSKLWDDGSSHRDLLPNAYDASKLWGPSSLDRRHVMSLAGVYELPFMNSGRTLFSRLLGGWTISFISQFQTGTPFSIATSDDTAGVGPGSGSQLWVVNGNPILPSGQKSFSQSNLDPNFWFKTKKEDGSEMFSKAPAGTFNMQKVRNQLFGPGLQNHNISVFKEFPVAEYQKIQLRLEAFNWLNHPNWDPPSSDPNSGSFGKVQNKSGERGLQFALRYFF